MVATIASLGSWALPRCAIRALRMLAGAGGVSSRANPGVALTAAIFGVAMSFGLGHAGAQEAASASTPATSSDLEEIVITAQKRVENVQDVPHQVSVVSQESLDASGVTDIQDLGRIVPSVVGLSAGPGNPPPIRGVSSFVVSQAVQQQTGVVLDDIPQPSFSTLFNQLSDVERIEVLPGPQSTLSGRNAAGGLINIVTRNPTDVFTGSATAEFTNDFQQRVAGYISGPVVRTLDFSVSGYVNDFRGLLRNVGENGLYDDRTDDSGIRAKLRWSPSDSFTALVTGFTTTGTLRSPGIIFGAPYIAFNPANSLPIPFGLFGATYGNAFPLVQPSVDNRDIDSPRNSFEKFINHGATLRLDFDTPVGTLSSLSALMNSSQPRADDFITFPLGLLGPLSPPGWDGYAYTDTKVKYKSQELRLVSTAKTNVDYLLGVIYTDTPNDQYYRREALGNLFWERESQIRSTAAYGRLTWQFIPQTFVTGGVRYQADKSSYGWQTHENYQATSPQVGDFTGGSDYDFWTQEISLQHKFTDDVQAYVTFQNAQTGQAYDLEDNNSAFGPYANTTPPGVGSYANGLKPIPSERVKNYEVGLKAQWLERRLTTDFDVFDAKYSNYQVQTIPPATSTTAVPVIRLFAIGGVETKGAEFTGSWRASHQLTLSFNAAYLDAKITNYPGAQCYINQTAATGCDPTINPPTGAQDNLAGLSMPDTPKLNFNTSANFTLPLAAAPFDAQFSAFYRYQTSVRFDLYGDPYTDQGGYGILNLSAGIRDHNGHYSVDLFVNNVLNKLYYAALGHDATNPGSPFPNSQAITAGYARDSFIYGGVRIKGYF
jgi:iron complex outermembrane recepter protein